MGRGEVQLESNIKVEPEEFESSNELSRELADEILRKKAKILLDPFVFLKQISRRQAKKYLRPTKSLANQLAGKGNEGLEYWEPHTCYICSRVFAVRSTLAKHLNTLHAKAPAMLCDHCPKTYFDKTELRYHMTSHMQKSLACNVCDFRTACMRILRTHKLTHDRKEKCKICDKQVTSLRMHMKSHAPKDKCPLCGKMFTKYRLKSHLKAHEGHKCIQCDQSFLSNDELRRHNLRKHYEGKLFECHCGAVFKKKLVLYSHKLLSHNTKKVACEVCGKSYRYEAGFRRHWREQHLTTHGPVRKKARQIHRIVALNHDSPHLCDLCGRTYLNRMCYRNHVRIAHLNPKKYFCDMCPMIRNTKQGIRAHLRQVHLQIRPYHCDFCLYKSYKKKYLEKHLTNGEHVFKKNQICEKI